MFQNLKHKNARESHYKDLPHAGANTGSGFNRASGADGSVTKGNEATRLVRCRICGFPCDKERDSKAKYDTWAGLGINQGEQLTAGTTVGDRRVPSATGGATSADQYYERTMTGGCPCCGSLTYWT